jgi:hypothetical protein
MIKEVGRMTEECGDMTQEDGHMTEEFGHMEEMPDAASGLAGLETILELSTAFDGTAIAQRVVRIV